MLFPQNTVFDGSKTELRATVSKQNNFNRSMPSVTLPVDIFSPKKNLFKGCLFFSLAADRT
jgi:hypothetical protein